MSTNKPELRRVALPNEAPAIQLRGDWTTLALAPKARHLSEQLLQWVAHPEVSWDLSAVQKLDQAGALLLWHAWGRSLPHKLTIPAVLEEYFNRLPRTAAVASQGIALPRQLRRVVMQLGLAALAFANQLRDIVVLVGQLLLDAANIAKHPSADGVLG
jgi:phospholipid/cholesterol/gamma-HCH transport system permease protein